MTSHAAVVARGIGEILRRRLRRDQSVRIRQVFRVNGTIVRENEWLTLTIYRTSHHGQSALDQPTISGEFGVFMGWADKIRKLKVRSNSDIRAICHCGREFGAEGIGLCRTEHMFFAEDACHSCRK